MAVDREETKYITYAAPRMTVNEQWNPQKTDQKDRVNRDELQLQRKADQKFQAESNSRAHSGYKRKYQDYVKRVTEYNDEVDEWNEANPTEEEFEHTELKPEGTAWFLEPTLPFDEQVALVHSYAYLCIPT